MGTAYYSAASMPRTLGLALAAVLLFLAPTQAQAGFLIFLAQGDYESELTSQGLIEEDIVFADADAGLILQGETSTLGPFGVKGNETLAAVGTTRIEGQDGGFFSAKIAPDSGEPFRAFSLVLDTFASSSGSYTFTATDQNGLSSSLVVGSGGFLGVVATDATRLSSISIAANGSTEIEAIAGLGVATHTPEPGTLTLAGTALLTGMVLLRRRRRPAA